MLGADKLESSFAEKELEEVLVAKTVNSILGCIREKIDSRRRGDPCPLLSTGETLLECWVQCRAPHYTREMDVLETVQQKATKIMKGVEFLSFEACLRQLGLLRLGKRWLREILSVSINTW